MTKQATCAETLPEYLSNRLSNIRDLQDRIGKYGNRELEYDAEDARTELQEMPLCVETLTVHKITLGTGGPADWFEVFTNDGGSSHPDYGEGECTRIVYHYQDWFDHAERSLEGDEFQTALEFANEVMGTDFTS